MTVRAMVNRALDILLDPGALRGLASWPTFSLASYRIVSSLTAQSLSAGSVIDAGANIGQFSVAAAKLLKPDSLYAFEPLPEAYANLVRHSKALPGVDVRNVALGERVGEVEFHVNAHSHSSSILALGDAHRQAFPGAVESEVIKVPLTTLDQELAGVDLPGPCLLKLDVQGYEHRVLEGARETLTQVDYVLSELSFKPMYDGERSFREMLELIEGYGFRFVRPLDFLRDPRTDEILQIDALFERAVA